MKNNETGEFELVLGNRQLLSGFAIVVILFGVFFTMGYIVGRNSSPAGPGMRPTETAAAPPVGDQKLPSAVGAPISNPPAADSTKPSEGAAATAGEGTPPATQAAKDSAQPDAKPPEPAASGTVAAAAAEPTPNQMYLQVASVQQSVADVVLKTLKEKGFPASLSPGPNGLTRVLVGPYADTGSIGKAKSELESAGFHPWVNRGK